jgi:hypothetical protein
MEELRHLERSVAIWNSRGNYSKEAKERGEYRSTRLNFLAKKFSAAAQ